jgi:hypothetical protein
MAPFSPFPRAHPRGKNCGGTEKKQGRVHPPSVLPLGLGPPRSRNGAWVRTIVLSNAGRNPYEISLLQPQFGGGQIKQGHPGKGRPFLALILFLACLFAGSLPSQRCLHTLLFAGLQVKGVALYLLDNVFLLHLAFKAAQSVLEGFSLLKPYFCQTDTPPDSSGRTE